MATTGKKLPTAKAKKPTPAPQEGMAPERQGTTYKDWVTIEGLLLINGWARDGLLDTEIAAQIGINPATLYKWKIKHPQIKDALRNGKQVADRQVEAALFKRAIGYDYEEVKTVARVVNGKVTKDADVTKTKKHVPGDVTAQIFWLKNRMAEQYRESRMRGDAADAGGVEDLTPLAKLLEIGDGK